MSENKTAFVPEMPHQQIYPCAGLESEYHTEGKMKHCQEGPGLWAVRCHACNKPFIIEVGCDRVWESPGLINPIAREAEPLQGVMEEIKADIDGLKEFIGNNPELFRPEYLTESEALSFAAWYSDRCNEGSDYAGELTIEAWRAEQ